MLILDEFLGNVILPFAEKELGVVGEKIAYVGDVGPHCNQRFLEGNVQDGCERTVRGIYNDPVRVDPVLRKN